MFGSIFLRAPFLLLPFSTDALDITFPPVSGMKGFQKPVTNKDGIDIVTGSDFSGLTTFANLPHANCFTAYDIWTHMISPSWAPHSTLSVLPTDLLSWCRGSNVTRV